MDTLQKDTPSTIFERLSTSFKDGTLRDIENRKKHLRIFRELVLSTKTEMQKALYDDLGRYSHQVLGWTITGILVEIDNFLNNLNELIKPKPAKSVLLAKVSVQPMPKGTMLIIGPANFPILLVLRPAVAAIASGNTVLIKPSEIAPASEKYLKRLIGLMNPYVISVICGDANTSKELMNFKWNHVLFTGSTTVGKKIMEAASKNLTPVTLELGGKNPVVVAQDAELPTAAMSLVQGKFENAGQFCIAPDYCLVEESIVDELCTELKKAIAKYYKNNPKTSLNYSRLIPSYFKRISKMKSESKGEIIVGGEEDETDNYIAPTVMKVRFDDILMEEEIFGPILLIVSINSTTEALDYINSQPQPLSLYLFTKNDKLKKCFKEQTRSGNFGINETIFQVAPQGSHVGGVGASGLGGGYGFEMGFRTFTHARPTIECPPGVSKILRGVDLQSQLSTNFGTQMYMAMAGIEVRPKWMKFSMMLMKNALGICFSVGKAFIIVRMFETFDRNLLQKKE